MSHPSDTMECPLCGRRFDQNLAFCPQDGTALIPAADPDPSLVGRIFADRYRILRQLDDVQAGTMDAPAGPSVCEAEQFYLGRKAILKLLRPPGVSETQVQRLLQEALAHSAIAVTTDHVLRSEDVTRCSDGSLIVVFEHVVFQTLADLLEAGPVSPSEALEILIQACEGLQAAHSLGFVHRFLSPRTLWLVRTEGKPLLVKLAGFDGVQLDRDGKAPKGYRAGNIEGDPRYLSPEQAMGRELDPRIDLYSLGVILYELFTGTVPFQAESFMGILTQHITAKPIAPRTLTPDRNIPSAVEEIILKAIAKEPSARYASAAEMQGALKRALEPPPEAPAPAPQMNVRITSDPVGAQVDLQGLLRDLTPCTVAVVPGLPFTIKLNLPGYRETVVTFSTDWPVTVKVKLDRGAG